MPPTERRRNGDFYDIQGKELETSLSERMIGVSLDDIRACREVVCVVYGQGKAEAIFGAMRAGLLNTLIIDENVQKGSVFG